MFCSALWGALCAAAHSPHGRPRHPGILSCPCLRDQDHASRMCELETLSCRWGGYMGVGIVETGSADHPFPAAEAVLIEDCPEQRGFSPVNILLRWKEQFIPPRVIASRLSVNSGETCIWFRFSGFPLQWRGRDCNLCARKARLEVGWDGGLPPAELGPPSLMSAVHSSCLPFSVVQFSMARPRCWSQPCTGVWEANGSGFDLRPRRASGWAVTEQGLCSWWH